MKVIYPEGDWKEFKGTDKKPFFFLCKFCGQVEYFGDSNSYDKACTNCENTRWNLGHIFTPITIDTAINWFVLTTGWLKDLLIAQLIEATDMKHKAIGKCFYELVFVNNRVKLH